MRDLAPGELHPGFHQVSWDGCDAIDHSVVGGVYLVQLRAGVRRRRRN